MLENNDNKDKGSITSPQKRTFLVSTINFATEFGFIIALPLIVFAYIGKRLDAQHHTHYYALLGVLLALTTTIVWLTQRIRQILRRLKQ